MKWIIKAAATGINIIKPLIKFKEDKSLTVNKALKARGIKGVISSDKKRITMATTANPAIAKIPPFINQKKKATREIVAAKKGVYMKFKNALFKFKATVALFSARVTTFSTIVKSLYTKIIYKATD